MEDLVRRTTGPGIEVEVVAGAGLWLTWAIFEAGHWFTLTRGEETARIDAISEEKDINLWAKSSAD